MTRPHLLVAALALALAAAAPPAAAQHFPPPEHPLGLGAQVSFPYDELGDGYRTGWGVAVLADYPVLGLLHACGSAGLIRFPDLGDGDGVTVWEVTAGGRVPLGVFFMGGEMGWYDRETEWSWVPSMGLRFTRFEASVRWRAVGANAYTGLRVGWYF